jgi:hypothetical protein
MNAAFYAIHGKAASVHPWTSQLTCLTLYYLRSFTQIPLIVSLVKNNLQAWYGDGVWEKDCDYPVVQIPLFVH